MAVKLVGLSRFELLTPRLSSVCSNQLSYRPKPTRDADTSFKELGFGESLRPVLSKLDRTCAHMTVCQSVLRRPGVSTRSIFQKPLPASGFQLPAISCWRLVAGDWQLFSRKEVIQPQVLLQLPCYDFTPITDHTLGASLPCGLVWRLLVQPAFVM